MFVCVVDGVICINACRVRGVCCGEIMREGNNCGDIDVVQASACKKLYFR